MLCCSALIGAAAATVAEPVRPVPPRLFSDVSLLTSEALIMTGTAMPVVSPGWMRFVSHNFIAPIAGDDYVNTPVTLPVQLWPVTGLDSLTYTDSTAKGLQILEATVREVIARNQTHGTPTDPLVVFGGSQSGPITGMLKQVLLEDAANHVELPPISLIMTANPTRPNGGLFSRFYGLGLNSWNPIMAPSSNTPFPSYDIAHQYDFFSDFPEYPLNGLAVVNAFFGLMNHNYGPTTLNPADPNYDPNTVVQKYGDTTYYLIPSKLPLLDPLRMIGLAPVADFLDPVLKVFVELGYNRTSYGQYTVANWNPFGSFNPEKFVGDLSAALQQSLMTLTPHAAAAQSPGTTLPAIQARVVPTTVDQPVRAARSTAVRPAATAAVRPVPASTTKSPDPAESPSESPHTPAGVPSSSTPRPARSSAPARATRRAETGPR